MTEGDPGTLTRLLAELQSGNSEAEERLVRVIYDELRALAASKLRGRRRGDTLSPTVLVHEAYLRVLRANAVPPQNRRHLFFAFARAMWQIIVEGERRRKIRDAKQPEATDTDFTPSFDEDIGRLDSAMQALRAEHPFEYEVTLLRKILGFSIPDTATLLQASEATVKRGWAFAKAELSRNLCMETSYES